MRKVINKAVDEEDLIRTVATAYSHGWRQVKLYFMCGLPTETDEDVLEIADLATRVIAKGREVTGRNDIRCTVSIGGFVPEAAHAVPVGRPARPRDHRRAAAGSCATSCAPTSSTAGRSASATTTASPASSRGCSRAATAASAAVIEEVWRDGGRFDGWSEHFSYDRWLSAAASARWPAPASTSTGTPSASATTTRCCPGTTSTPVSTRTGSGRTGRTPSPSPTNPDALPTSRTAAGPPATTAASARRWTPRSRSAPRAGAAAALRCLRRAVVGGCVLSCRVTRAGCAGEGA